jgi:3-oxoadipate enol-lactonase
MLRGRHRADRIPELVAFRYVTRMQLHHEVAGSGPAVVLIHEGIADSRMWDPQWPSYTSRFRTLRYDMRGFGESPLPPGPWSNAEDLIELLGDVGIERAALVGVSLGARVALEVALARPDVVSAVVLVGAALFQEAPEDVRGYWEEEERLFAEGDPDGAAELTVRFWVVGVRRDEEDVDPDVRRRVFEMQRRSYDHWEGVGEEIDERTLVPDVADRAGEVGLPVLLIVGEHDRAACQETAERLAQQIPGARLERMAAAAHAPSMERPAEFDALVLPFLEAHA